MGSLRVVPQSGLIAPSQRTILLLLLEIYHAITLPLGLTVFSQQGAAMGDLREKCARLQEQGQQWLKREEELIGVLLWAVGITTLASLPDTGIFIPVHPPVFLGLKVCAALLWLIVGAKGVQRLAQRNR
jgi:hypothetical protein